MDNSSLGLINAYNRYVLGEWMPEALSDIASLLYFLIFKAEKGMVEWFSRWKIDSISLQKNLDKNRESNLENFFEKLKNGKF